MSFASAGVAAQGTLLQIDNGAGSYTTVAEVTKIDGPGFTVKTASITNHSNTDAAEEVVATTVDPGKITLELNWLPTNTTQSFTTSGMLKDLWGRTLRNFKMIWPYPSPGSPTTWIGAGYVTGWKPSAPVDGKLGVVAEITLSGKPSTLA